MRRSVWSPACASSASVGGRRPAASSTGRSSSTSTSHVQGTRASERLTWPTASKPSGGAIAALVGHDRAGHAIDAERAQVVAAVVVGGEVPAPGVHDESERAEIAAAGLARERAVGGVDAPPAPDGVGQQQRHAAADGRAAGRGRREAERLLERHDLAAQLGREHAQDLRERAVDRLVAAAERRSARTDQPEHDGDGLVVVQHQRRQAIARADAVAAADAALPLDRDVERLQRLDVAADGARVDAEALRDLAPGRERLRLEDLQQLEQTGRRGQHVRSQAHIEGVIRPVLPIAWAH